MKKLEWRVNRKKEILERYKQNLKSIKQINFFKQDLKNTTPWFIDVFVEDSENLQLFLKENNIGTLVMYPSINKQKAFKCLGNIQFQKYSAKRGFGCHQRVNLRMMKQIMFRKK